MIKRHTLPDHLRFISPAALIATFFGSGLLKPASGTWGTLAALVPGVLIGLAYGVVGLFIAALLGYIAGHWASTKWIAQSDDKDPSAIVIDEAVGIWVTLMAAPLTPLGIVVAFGLFRFFDITKPWPVGWADKNFGGATGIMLDDVLAGILAGFMLMAARNFEIL